MIAKKAFATGLLFLASAAVPFTLLAPRVAMSGVRAVSRWGGCDAQSTISWTCTGVAGTDFLTSSLTGGYFEYIRWSTSSFTATVTLKKQSYNGTLYGDSATVSHPAGSGFHEAWVGASQVKQNADQWDFLFAEFLNSSSTPSAITPMGILFTN
jgi:hypothetical protein